MNQAKKADKAKKQPNYGATVITWQAPEFRELDRGPNWFLLAGITAVMLIGWSIWQGGYPFAIVVILISGIYFLTHKEKPKTIDIALTTNGIVADGRFYPYTEIDSFWILFNPETDVKTLNIFTKTGMVREITFQLADQDPSELRSFLGAHVYELPDRTETVIEKIIRVCKL